jgi:glycosyltransferase involved in cell wall biosynthesis
MQMTAAAKDAQPVSNDTPDPSRASTPRPLRVAFVDHTARLGGGEIALLNLVSNLDPALVTPIVILFSAGPLADALRAESIETHIVPASAAMLDTRKNSLGVKSIFKAGTGLAALRHVRRVAAKLRALNVDIVHTNSLKADIIGGLAGRLARRCVVWHVRDRIADDYLPATTARLFRRLCRLIPHFVIANSASTLSTLELPSTPKVAVVPSGVRRYSEIIHDGTPAEAEQGHASLEQTPVIGIVGRISPWKGQHVFLRAAAIVHQRRPEARFKIVGSVLFGEEAYEQEIRALAISLGIDRFVDFAGFTHDVPATMAGLSIMVHASTTGEPFGQVVIEAMAAGKPVVATDGGGIPEIVQDGLTGLLVPMGDAPAMAAAILRLLDDPAAMLRMGARGRERVISHFTIEHTARKVEAVYAVLKKR